MDEQARTETELRRRLAHVETQLEEAREALRRIRSGEVDTLAAEGPDDEWVRKMSQRLEHRVVERTSQVRSGLRKLQIGVGERDQEEAALCEREECSALALRGAQEGVWDWDVETNAVWYSHRYKEMLGYSEDEIEPHVSAWKRLLHPDDEARALEVVDSVLHEGREYEMEFRLRHKDGHYLDILSRGLPVRREAGGPITRIVGIHFDLTERKRAEDELRRTKDYLQSIVDCSLTMIITVDQNRRIVAFNRAAQTTLGYSADEIIGRPVQILYADSEEARKVHEIVQTTGQFCGEITNRTKSGSTFVTLLEASPLHDERGRVFGTLGISRDITARKQAEEKLRESQERFRVAQELSLDAFTILDAVRDESGAIVDFRWVYANPKAGRVLRRVPDELVGQGLLDVLPGNKANSDLFDHYVHVVETGQPHDFELPYDSDGILGWFRNMTVKLGDGIAVYFNDITERKRAEAERAALHAAMERSHGDLISILNRSRQGIVMTDREGRITFVSESCRQFLGREPESVYGSNWMRFFPIEPKDKAAFRAMVRRAPDQRGKLTVRMHNAKGQRFSMEVELLDDPRDPERKIVFIYDMTEVYTLRGMLEEKPLANGLTGRSQAIQHLTQEISDLAMAQATVLIEGETGTGKELVAHAIHAIGPRSKKLFLPVNCAGLTESLIGSQLFGHKRGAFTGAIADHHGVFETAKEGTVFLDEIGDLPLSMQTNLLRVLQEKEVTRLGESTPRRVDVRVVAATHQNLDQLVSEGKFRKDLLYRIRVARVAIPPLRERREDIPLLVESFLAQAAEWNNKQAVSVSDEAMRRMLKYDWPGNVRELQSAIESACIGCKGSVIQVEDLPPELNTPPVQGSSSGNTDEDARNCLVAAIRAAEGNRTKAARQLGISRATLYRRLQESPLEPDGLP